MTSELTNAHQPDSRRARRPERRAPRATQSASPIDLGKSLGVNMVLTGTVQRDKTRLRVTARLVNTADGFTVWSDMFERDSQDVFKVQDEISSAIVAAISPELSGAAPVGGSRARADGRGDVGRIRAARHDRPRRRTISTSAAVSSSTSAARPVCAARSTTSSRRRSATRSSRARTPASPTCTRCCRSTRTCASTR